MDLLSAAAPAPLAGDGVAATGSGVAGVRDLDRFGRPVAVDMKKKIGRAGLPRRLALAGSQRVSRPSTPAHAKMTELTELVF